MTESLIERLQRLRGHILSLDSGSGDAKLLHEAIIALNQHNDAFATSGKLIQAPEKLNQEAERLLDLEPSSLMRYAEAFGDAKKLIKQFMEVGVGERLDLAQLTNAEETSAPASTNHTLIAVIEKALREGSKLYSGRDGSWEGCARHIYEAIQQHAPSEIPVVDEDAEAVTVNELIGILKKFPGKYQVYINTGRGIFGILGAEDIGGDYFSQVFLKSYNCEPDKTPHVREIVSVKPVPFHVDQDGEIQEGPTPTEIEDGETP